MLKIFSLVVLVLLILLFTRKMLYERAQQNDLDGETYVSPHVVSPDSVVQELNANTSSNATSSSDIAYGTEPAEKLDIYKNSDVTNAPVIVMVHGGGWMVGDKANEKLLENKVPYWVPKGYVFISMNYPMLPSHPPDEQAASIAKALIFIQNNASQWGGDPNKMVVMGHSAGAHLVALVSSQREAYPGLSPWQGTVILDSGALDLMTKMNSSPAELYNKVFGADPNYWQANSPIHALNGKTEPLLLVCSSRRRQEVCDETEKFASTAHGFGTTVTILPVALSHESINVELGLASEYTTAVDAFIRSVTE